MTTNLVRAPRRLVNHPLTAAFASAAAALLVAPAVAFGGLPVVLSWVVLAFSAGYAISGSV